jgi:hypothetical protein
VGICVSLQGPEAKGKFVWWLTLPALFGLFGAMVLAVIGLQDLSRQGVQRRPGLAAPGTTKLTHRWGWTIFRGAGALAVICCLIGVGLALASGLPVLAGLALGVSLVAVVTVVAGALYLVIVGVRIAYLTTARYLGHGELPLPGQVVRGKVDLARGENAPRQQETPSDQVQAAPTNCPSKAVTPDRRPNQFRAEQE